MGIGKPESKDPDDQGGEQKMSVDIRKRILSVGEPIGRKRPGKVEEKKVRCQGCGEEIRSDGDLENIEYVKTRRGSEYFFHTGCVESVWKHKIC